MHADGHSLNANGVAVLEGFRGLGSEVRTLVLDDPKALMLIPYKRLRRRRVSNLSLRCFYSTHSDL
jgi:hypothetical protein